MTDHGTPDRLTPQEVSVELHKLSAHTGDSVRAVALARYYARGLRHLTPEDLLQEAFTQLRTGQRSWPRNLSPLRAFSKAMHSIASNARKKADYMLAGDLNPSPEEALDPDSPCPVDFPHAAADPARIVEAQSELARAQEAVRADPDAGRLLETWADGLRGQEAMQELGWDARRYDAARKRLLRRLAIASDQGSTP